MSDRARRITRIVRAAGALRARRAVGALRARPAGEAGIDLPAPVPPCPPGWETGPPDFVGVGVQRCGTTRWYDLIAAHPEVAMPSPEKELHFFDRFFTGGFSESDAQQYARYFPRPRGARVGEWTPLYASAPWVPPLLARAAPRARLLVLLRDPVERLLSGLALAARVSARRGSDLSRYAPLDAFARGLYHAQLSRLLEHFERSQLLVLQYERCTREPAGQLRRTYEFLGVGDSGFLPSLEAHPRRQESKPALDEAARAAYVNAYAPDVRRLAAEFPEIDLALWPNFSWIAED